MWDGLQVERAGLADLLAGQLGPRTGAPQRHPRAERSDAAAGAIHRHAAVAGVVSRRHS